MNYEATLQYIYDKLPMFSRIGGAAYKADLYNTIALCEAIGNPQRRLKAIHVAGTNGKGSVSHMLAAILQRAGYTTGLYTSPHLRDFRERIRVNGALADKDFVVRFIERLRPVIETLQPSFFEITVAMAFACFEEQQTDIVVLETGMGGRLDSTNVIDPLLSIITNIGLDHVQFLGDTLEKIAAEKAGIIKPGKPVIIGQQQPETTPVFTAAAQLAGSPLYFAEEQFYVNDFRQQPNQLELSVVRKDTGEHLSYALDLQGIYQTRNVLPVLTAVHLLQAAGWIIPEAAVHAGLAATRKLTGLHGRWEKVHRHPDLILDVAHNQAGMAQVLEQLELTDYRHLHLVTGMVKDKDVAAVLAMLPKTATFYFTRAQIERAMPEAELAVLAADAGLAGHIFPDVNTAIGHALQHAHENDLILVCGSVFLVGEVNLLAI